MVREPANWHDDDIIAAALGLIQRGQPVSPNSPLYNELLHRGFVRRDTRDKTRLHLTREGRDFLDATSL
jgi:hypothetical protein